MFARSVVSLKDHWHVQVQSCRYFSQRIADGHFELSATYFNLLV